MAPPGSGTPARASDRRQFLRTLALGTAGVVGAPMILRGRCRLLAAPTAGAPLVDIPTRALDLVLGSTVIDMLGLLTLDWNQLFRWHRDPSAFAEADFRKLQASGINVFHPAVEPSEVDAHRAALRWLGDWRRLIQGQGCFFTRIDSISDLLVAPKQRRIGVVMGFQNSNHFASTADVEAFYGLGQRVSQLTYNTRNRLGFGCFEKVDRGLTPFGADIVAAMNRVGMTIDVSHCGERTSLEAIAASKRPVLVTHSNCRALVLHARCKSDQVIRLLAAGGGVMGITMVRAFVSFRPQPTIEDLLDHFDHVARLAGPEHVGIGSDVDVDAADPRTGRTRAAYDIRGLHPATRVFQLAEGLLRRGYSERDVELVLGGNFVRVLTETWPDSSWMPSPDRDLARDPFCPVPLPIEARS
ncbi:MAG TPA: membrane dipeptidase [Thermoanaerobaculia bacterium]|nr:membrane dipeptidase [Thermoanaerobaculia bacterium]